jgi:hypothetical protein
VRVEGVAVPARKRGHSQRLGIALMLVENGEIVRLNIAEMNVGEHPARQ